jgi:phosphoenolpyruvate carboxykinase (GTP)
MRVLEWIIARCNDRVDAVDTPIGRLPRVEHLNVEGLELPTDAIERLLAVDRDAWRKEFSAIGEYLQGFGDRLPPAMRAEHARVRDALVDTPRRAVA